VPADDLDTRMRAAMFAHLDRLRDTTPGALGSDVFNTFTFEGRDVKLIVQPGIRKPAELDAALTIRTTYTPDDGVAPYEDGYGPDGTLRYKWRGTDPNHADNRALRVARERQVPLVYFVAVARAVYEAIYPVYLVDEDPAAHEFSVLETSVPGVGVTLDRRYAHGVTKRRLHQVKFRAAVLRAYDRGCAVCDLRHGKLLDAAHIIPDAREGGDPVVPNGLAMCKIHHAAYDAHIIGIRPDRVVEVRTDILDEIDGPMLRHGLQEMHRRPIFVPRAPRDRPDENRLAERYAQFRAA
jgi:putative restriction endonuclease